MLMHFADRKFILFKKNVLIFSENEQLLSTNANSRTVLIQIEIPPRLIKMANMKLTNAKLNLTTKALPEAAAADEAEKMNENTKSCFYFVVKVVWE